MTTKHNNGVNEFYKVWKGLPSPIYVDGLHDDFEGFRLLLRESDPTKPVLRISFPDQVAYRNINESDRLRTWARNPDAMTCAVFEVVHSTWLQWLAKESFETIPLKQLRHFAIHTAEDCVDVISASTPIVEELGS